MSNDACRGYVILAMRALKFDNKDIEKVVDELHYVFDITPEEVAEKTYYDPFKYDNNEKK